MKFLFAWNYWWLLTYLPKKSVMSRPSQNLPEGWPKKVSPLGVGTSFKAADEMPPVSEFKSPKLYVAGKSHLRTPLPPHTNAGNLAKPTTKSTKTQHSFIESMFFLATSHQKVCTHIIVGFHFDICHMAQAPRAKLFYASSLKLNFSWMAIGTQVQLVCMWTLFFLLLLLGDDMELIMMTIKKLFHLRRIRLLAKIHFSLSNFVVVVLWFLKF